jgi:hypothetical protein
MNRFDDAVQDLLANAPAHPGLDALRTRVRRRRRRRTVVIVATVGVISFASVGVAASLGHDSSSPHIAVSPTSSTTTTVARRCPEVDALAREEAVLEAQAKWLDGALKTAIDAHAPDAGGLDAQHQAVLRQLSDLMYRRLQLEDGAACVAANDSSATTSTSISSDCAAAIAAAKRSEIAALDHEQRSLRAQERAVSGQLMAALVANSADVGVLDAKHQAILRRLFDVQQQIIAIKVGPRPDPSCTPRP